ncbi:MAG TPA: hypothetical protein VFU22_09220 [Roseiflexaceae bacterium]|nr:hypothetical protein [Roseiflexaceae bacterium]
MTTLYRNESGEWQLTLYGAAENRILTTLRRWPHWQRVAIERDPLDPRQCLALTLITDQEHESTLREILQRSFAMTFPAVGGSMAIGPELAAPSKRRRR